MSSNEGGKGAKHGDKWEKNTPGRHKNKHKGLEVGECSTNESQRRRDERNVEELRSTR